jgi:methionyl-tRNA formyltransferase
MKIVFFGTANVALPVLEALRKEHEILSVVTTPDAAVGRKQEMQESPVSALAIDLKLPLLKPESVKNNREFSAELQKLGADIFVVVAYGKILPMEIINLPKFKTINIHFSMLPKYRGPSPMQTALLNGDSETGISIFILDEKVDTGPVLFQEAVGIDSDDNLFTLSDKLARKSAEVINSVVADYVSGKITPVPQATDGVTETKIITKAEGKIDWNKTSQEIYNQFRAFFLWPNIWTTWNGQVLKITECLPAESSESAVVGAVLDGAIVACGNGTFLKINRLQLAGKTETSIGEFLNGYQNFIGSKLE